jgi:hypothetical protein
MTLPSHAAASVSACAAQGNGHERDKIHFDDADTFILDAYNSDIWPNDRKARAAIDVEVPPALQRGALHVPSTIGISLSTSLMAAI